MEKCPECHEPQKGKYWCRNCKRVFVCPNPQCGVEISTARDSCPRCGLLFEDYIVRRKMYRRCPKCKKKQGLSDNQCRSCHYWFTCPTCGHPVTSTSMLSCPRCATRLR